MNADTLNLADIFRKDIRYQVPMFQRPYVWNEEEHWQVLWEDLVQAVEERLEQQVDGQPPQPEAVSAHFLGAMVLDQLQVPVKKLESREVIDGQQRLTTLQVLLSAIRAVARELGVAKQASLVKKLIYNDEDLVHDPIDRYKIWPIEPDRAAFCAVMDGDGVSSADQEGHALINCYRFFHDVVREWAVEADAADQRLEALVSTLWSHVRIVAIDLEANDEPQMIFETLNARGTPLLAADLIKNFLFREAQRKSLPVDELHAQYWAPFDQKAWRENVRQGRLERPRIDVYVMHWLSMRTGRVIRAQHLFREFQRYLIAAEETVEETLSDIAHHASIYLSFSDPYPPGRQGVFFRRLEELDTSTPLPVLLRVFGDEEVTEKAKTRVVEALESWLVRRMLCRLTTKNYNRTLTDLLVALDATPPAQFDALVIDFLRSKKTESEFWPDDSRLIADMSQLKYWSRVNQRRLRMVFRALERQLRGTGYSESVEFDGTLQIEHILPQEWAHYWPLPGEKSAELERIAREEAKDRIGNLTVLTKKLNPSISNAGWERKRDAIREHTVLLLNQRLVDTYKDTWDESAIEQRGRTLAQTAVEVWPGPGSPHWD